MSLEENCLKSLASISWKNWDFKMYSSSVWFCETLWHHCDVVGHCIEKPSVPLDPLHDILLTHFSLKYFARSTLTLGANNKSQRQMLSQLRYSCPPEPIHKIFVGNIKLLMIFHILSDLYLIFTKLKSVTVATVI